MDVSNKFADSDLPDLRTIIIPHRGAMQKPEPKSLRRSPRKHTTAICEKDVSKSVARVFLSATSNQRQSSPAKTSPAKRSPLKLLKQAAAPISLLDDVPMLPRKPPHAKEETSVSNTSSSSRTHRPAKPAAVESLLLSFSKLDVDDDASDRKNMNSREAHQTRTLTTAVQSRKLGSVKGVATSRSIHGKSKSGRYASQFVLDEARCEEDLLDSDAQDEGEDEDTDLSGFIVDDDAELSYHGSSDEADSEVERRSRRKQERVKPRRRLQRGRRRTADSDEESAVGDELANAFDNMQLGSKHLRNEKIETIDLTSPDQESSNQDLRSDHIGVSDHIGINLFDKFKALKLSPPRGSQLSDLPSKSQFDMPLPTSSGSRNDKDEKRDGYTTPPTTPPKSPSKLRSPSKLLSPSKHDNAPQRSPHRPSMDAFWDLNEVNEWNDQFSPKKAPIGSPRKNRLAEFGIWSDEEDEAFEAVDESSDSLPSPCESPSKSKFNQMSPVKAEKQRIMAEKKAKQLERKLFEETRDKMANDLLRALDENVVGSRISKLSASTGGVQIIWSNTLRSTAGRANWRRTVTKPTGSPVKGKADESGSGNIVQHFANIELAVKVIDRPDRLINTLAHEFCHLANFMVSGIRDQPHGASFQTWARHVTSWMRSQTDVPEWKTVEVTTKHGYVIEWKYLWVCVGRDQNKAMEFLNIDDDDGCGAEYGRHSKSIDPETQRCGRCKGRLLQVRPKPRQASPVKKTMTTTDRTTRANGKDKKTESVERKGRTKAKGDVDVLEKMVEVVELSD